MTTNRQYFPVSTFKTQASTFMTPAVLRRVETPVGFPVECMELTGDSAGTTKSGFFIDGPCQYVLGAGDISWRLDFIPLGVIGDNTTSAVCHADISVTQSNTGTNLTTRTFVTNNQTGTRSVRGYGSSQSVTIPMSSGVNDTFTIDRRFTVRIYREPLNASDTYTESIGVFGVWAIYDDV
jgi:hypothetical protein